MVCPSLSAAPRWLAAVVLHVGMRYRVSHGCAPLGGAGGGFGHAYLAELQKGDPAACTLPSGGIAPA